MNNFMVRHWLTICFLLASCNAFAQSPALPPGGANHFDAGGFNGTGFFNGGVNSYASGINPAGDVVVGFAVNSNAVNEAFRWTQAGGMQGLGVLNGGISSVAYSVNAAGDVVVGLANNGALGNRQEAFRWTQTGGMQGLGVLNGGTYSEALAVNAAGDVVVGYAFNGALSNRQEAFRWTQTGGMQGLGVLNGGTHSGAFAVNAAGDVIVGTAFNGAQGNRDEAFRWTQSGGMQSVADWLSHAGVSLGGFSVLSAATGVSANSNTIVGYGVDSSSFTEAFIARVDASKSGIVGVTDLFRSLTQSLSVSSQLGSLTGLALNGSHHRTLMDIGMTDGQTCGWANGDVGRDYRQANGYIGIAEIGACHDLENHDVRFGLGVGESRSGLSLANNGHSRLDGQYGIAEIDWQLPNHQLIASLLGTYGHWDADLKRGYAIAGTATSDGSTGISACSMRARLDWKNAFYLQQVGFSPRIAYTVSHSSINGYQETGGSAPATFADQNHTAREVRVGLDGEYALNDKTTLLGHGEAAHRFDDHDATVSGSVNALGVGIGFSQPGNAVKKDWVRLGAEVDFKITDRSSINGSGFVATAGQDADISAAFSWKYLF